MSTSAPDKRKRAPALEAFARAYLHRLAPDPGDDTTDREALRAEVEGAFALASSRDGEIAAVRVLNPTHARDGYEPAGTVVETNTPDLPFLVDSVTAALEARGLGVRRLRHPIVGVERGPDGRITAVTHARDAAARESVMHFELDRRLEPAALPELEAAVRGVLEDVRRVVLDFPAMSERVPRMIEYARAGAQRYDEDEVTETVAFLDWLLKDAFVFLGYREYDVRDGAIQAVPGSGLGLLADVGKSRYARSVPLADLPDDQRHQVLEGELLVVAKTNARSPVHRRDRMDYIGVRRVGANGETVGEARLLGLFTTRAYVQPAEETPLLRRKLGVVLAAEDLIEGSHDYKATVALFESFPRAELFTAPADELRRAMAALLALRREEMRVLARRAPDGRTASVIVALPRPRYDAELLERTEQLLRRRFGAAEVTTQLVFGEGEHARIHAWVHAAGGLREVGEAELERDLRRLARTWDDELADQLAARVGAARARALVEAWAPRFPDYYKASTHPRLAVADLLGLAGLATEGDAFSVGLQNEPDGAGLTRIALYKTHGKLELSRVMPVLEDLGLRVVEEVPTRLLGGDGETWVQDFGVLGPGDAPLDLDLVGARLAACIAAVYREEAESDSLNRLVVSAGLDWERLAILRAYRKYRQRIGSRYTEGFQNDVLATHPALTAKLMRLFELRFHPEHAHDDAARALREEILADLDAVASLDADRILRNQLGLIEATKRTNAYKPGRGAIAFKLRSPEVPAIPQPAPAWEIYVHALGVEGIHLRGGKVARGGIRWSERMDYRTEVYGLMRAQMTKNAVIVPTGAKGGFLLRRPPSEPAALASEVDRQYVAYIRALLDVTDDLVEGRAVHPPGVRVLDSDDAYLVVAADKGTARLSDTANRVAREYGFWLDDAFASGGSAGYDHKRLGITARGAWESVKRHFSELGLDPAVDVFSAVGIGDMSGDVFGNGMLLSDRVRLLGAYDHRHVFLDPDPDPAASFAERARLFALPRSSWADYDPAVLSAGGGVFPRTAKRVALSPQVRAALAIEAEELPPNEVIRAILRAPVDLLFNGGIGTVVKASAETDDDAQDRASDAIRVDASALRCRVVGEGGNLGVTRRARVEYALGGGRIFADFIDNSGGVDCSDHEVNLKILLGLAERTGELDRAGRDALLLEVTDDVVGHVLYDSFLQAQILAQEVRVSARRVYAYEDLMAVLEAEGQLDRAAEALPGTEEMGERRRAGRGLERPELALLVAYAKRDIAAKLMAAGFPDDPWLERDLRAYFPARVTARFAHRFGEHPLRRQLIATLNANDVVNALGPTFVHQLVAERGDELADVVQAYRIAKEVTGAAERWDAIERLDGRLAPELQGRLMMGVDGLVEAVTRWYLAWAPGADLGEAVAAGTPGWDALRAGLRELGSPEERADAEAAAGRLEAEGVPAELAREHVYLGRLEQGPDILAVAAATGRGVGEVALAFGLVGERLRLGWLERELARTPAETRTLRWALHAVREDLGRGRREVAERALAEAADAPVEPAVVAYLDAHPAQERRLGAFLRSLSLEGAADPAALALAVRHLRALAEA